MIVLKIYFVITISCILIELLLHLFTGRKYARVYQSVFGSMEGFVWWGKLRPSHFLVTLIPILRILSIIFSVIGLKVDDGTVAKQLVKKRYRQGTKKIESR